MQAILALALAVTASAANAEIVYHADAILAKQLDDGAIIHLEDGGRIVIEPYFGNYAALGLFEAYRQTRDKRYLDGGIAWTDWYLEHMTANGLVFIHEGTREEYHQTDRYDTSDSYPATFLVCANARRFLTHDTAFVMRERSRIWKSYNLMLSTADWDGLTYAKPDYGQKLTLGNAEVYEGLWHARQIARVMQDYEWNANIYYARRKMEKAFKELRGPDHLYAWAKAEDRTLQTAEDEAGFAPAGLANLAAVTLGPVGGCKARKTFNAVYAAWPDLTACDADHLYWWAMAAQRAGKSGVRQQAVTEMKAKTEARGLAVDHAHYIRALSGKRLFRPGGGHPAFWKSSFIDKPRAAVR